VHARITQFRIKSDARDAATAKLEELKPQILALPGMQRFIQVVGEDGNGYVISLIDDEAVSTPGSEQIKAIWSEFGEHLVAPPEPPVTYSVLANWET